ncbi:MAG: SO_0444 family Cu/Zn efflux transporter [Chlorobiaceae bacterium]
MHEIVAVLTRVLLACWDVLLESAPLALLGFFVAGLLKAFVPDDFISTHLGGSGIKSIFKAAALGIPVPLCSCGVVPAAAGLKKQGAGNGAVASFLISTPETGVDSIAVSYALLDPLMTVFRPLAGIVTAMAAGLAVSWSERNSDSASVASGELVAEGGCASSCCCSHHKPAKLGALGKFKGGMHFAFGELLKDVGGWLFFGILLAGLISVFVSQEMVSAVASNDFLSMVVMLVASGPLYVCATASTPVAAALALKGISPGAALVFLLAGPATNVASLTVISRMLGKRSTLVYLGVIVVMSLLGGLLINALYGWLGYDIRHWASVSAPEEAGVLSIAASVLLTVLVVRSFLVGGAHSHSH